MTATTPLKEKLWTGKAPQASHCPGVGADGKITSLPQLNLAICSRQEILDYFDNTWTLTEVLFSSLRNEEAFYRPPYHQLRHPLIFYYGHPAVLYVNKLRLAGLLSEGVHPHFESIFEVGVDEMSWDDMSKNEMRWPAVEEVTEYRQTVYRLIKNLIETHPAFDPSNQPFLQNSPAWALAMGFEHERIHLETSSVLIRELPLQWVRKPSQWPAEYESSPTPQTQATQSEWFRVPAREVSLGKPSDFPTFGWDNEYGRLSESVPEFEASRLLVSNGEFLEFVKDGGYRESRYWTDTGWSWRQYRNTKWPTFWVPDGPAGLHQYRLRATFELVELDLSLPSIVNFHEAQAYCSWKALRDGRPASDYRLLSEGEQLSLRQCVSGSEVWNSNLRYGSESPVHAHLSAETGLGDVFGNVWQWSRDAFHPLPDFQVHRFYEDFSTPCFDGKHQMIFGGSFVSTGDEASRWARFHFRPHFFQHAGFRIARSPSLPTKQHDSSGSSEIEIRLLAPDQLQWIVPLLHQRNPALSEELLSTRVSEMASQGFHCLGAYARERLVGISGFWIKTRYHTGKVIEPDNVYVDAAFQSQGIGAKMMEWIYDYGKKQGCLESELHCYVTNGDAHRFWLNQGYKIIAFHFGKTLN